MSSTTRRITALNNMGIKNLQRGFFAEAERSFRMAIECLHAKMGREQQQTDEEFLQQQPQQQDCMDEMSLYPVPLVCVSAATILQASPHNSLEVYQTAFAMPKMDDALLAFEMTSETTAILFYLFNQILINLLLTVNHLF